MVRPRNTASRYITYVISIGIRIRTASGRSGIVSRRQIGWVIIIRYSFGRLIECMHSIGRLVRHSFIRSPGKTFCQTSTSNNRFHSVSLSDSDVSRGLIDQSRSIRLDSSVKLTNISVRSFSRTLRSKTIRSLIVQPVHPVQPPIEPFGRAIR